jgi:hypothetical protein
MSFFQPDVKAGETSSTPSAESQAVSKFKAQILGQFLNSMAGTAPSYHDFLKTGSAQRSIPGGLGEGIGPLLEAMNQPGAFTSHATGLPAQTTPSMFSDLLQGGMTAALLSNMLGLSPLAGLEKLLQPLGGMLGIGKDTSLNPNDVPSNMSGMPRTVSVGGEPWGGGGGIDPGLQAILGGAGSAGSFGTPGYGVLDNSGSTPDWQSLLGYGY